MKRKTTNTPLPLDPSWPQEFKDTHVYDRLEIWGERFNAPYAVHYDQRRRRTLEALTTHCPAPAKILDLAAAGGNFSIAAAKLGYSVTWNDLRGSMADYVKLKMPKGADIEFLAGNIFELGEEYYDTFDAVMALEVIEHVAHPDEFLAKLKLLVKPGGTIIISTPNGAYFRNNLPRFSDISDPSIFEDIQFKPDSDGHIFLLYEDEMRSFAQRAGLEIISYEQFTNPLSAGHVKLRLMHKILPRKAIEAVESLTTRLPASARARLSSTCLAIYKK